MLSSYSTSAFKGLATPCSIHSAALRHFKYSKNKLNHYKSAFSTIRTSKTKTMSTFSPLNLSVQPISNSQASSTASYSRQYSQQANNHDSDIITQQVQQVTEIAIYNGKNENLIKSLSILATKRPFLKIIHSTSTPDSNNNKINSNDNNSSRNKELIKDKNEKKEKNDQIIWSSHRDIIQTDCTILEELYLGKNIVNEVETAEKWNQMLNERNNILPAFSSMLTTVTPTTTTPSTVYSTSLPTAFSTSTTRTSPLDIPISTPLSTPSNSYQGDTPLNAPLGDGGEYQSELNIAIAAVHRASFLSRSLQKYLLKGSAQGVLSKEDRSPVTIGGWMY